MAANNAIGFMLQWLLIIMDTITGGRVMRLVIAFGVVVRSVRHNSVIRLGLAPIPVHFVRNANQMTVPWTANWNGSNTRSRFFTYLTKRALWLVMKDLSSRSTSQNVDSELFDSKLAVVDESGACSKYTFAGLGRLCWNKPIFFWLFDCCLSRHFCTWWNFLISCLLKFNERFCHAYGDRKSR